MRGNGRLRSTAPGVVSLAALVAGLNGGAAQAQACFVASANGHAGSQICNLSDSATQLSAVANAVSGDGSVVVGELADLDGSLLAWRWRDGVFEAFPEPIRSSRSSANGVNADGTVVVGSVDTIDGLQAFYTVRQPSGAEQHFILPTVVGSGETFAESVNADGTIIVGTTTISASGFRAVRWVNGEIEDLGVLPDATIFPTSAATDVNAAGNVVVGAASDGVSLAFRWVEGDGMASLGTLPDHTFSRAEGVNAEGNVVVG